MVLLWSFVGFLGVLFLLWVMVPLWEWFIPLERKPDELHRAVTDDGWVLPLRRYKAPESSTRKHPVILCHGLGVNSVYMDFDEANSLARAVRDAGFDSWVVDLRSSSDSEVRSAGGKGRHDFSFDDLVQYDVPAVMEEVFKQTGATQIHWVGQSMGGMVALSSDPDGFMAVNPDQLLRFKSLAAMGSPTKFSKAYFPLFPLHPLLRWIPYLPTRFFTRIGVGLAPFVSFLFARMQRPGSQTHRAFRYSCLYMFAVLPSRLLLSFVEMLKQECLCTEEGDRLYDRRLREHKVPGFFLAGDVDGMAPYKAARYAYEQWQAPKEWHYLSPENGTESYGHGDMVLGTTAPKEVFPKVIEWLDKND